jgi:hypothetical protein
MPNEALGPHFPCGCNNVQCSQEDVQQIIRILVGISVLVRISAVDVSVAWVPPIIFIDLTSLSVALERGSTALVRSFAKPLDQPPQRYWHAATTPQKHDHVLTFVNMNMSTYS